MPNLDFLSMLDNVNHIPPLNSQTLRSITVRWSLLLLTGILLSGCNFANIKHPLLTSSAQVTPPNDTPKTLDGNDENLHDTAKRLDTRLNLTPAAADHDLWQRIRHGYKLPLVSNNRVSSQLSWYSHHPKYINRVAKRGEPYLYHIVAEVEARSMPLEIALLPIVESAFDPFAYSHGRASGVWQIIPGTGTMLGLEQNWWYDGRRDIVAATDAALTYLQRLNKQFNGDWMLALAAYNSGAGNVNKAIRKAKKQGRPTDFWHLDLPRETRAYVPKLLALARLIGSPDEFKLTLPPITNAPYFAQVDIGSQLDLAHAAELAGIDIEQIYRLNPAFNRWATAPKGPHKLLIPQTTKDIFLSRLALIPADERITWQRYTIRNGDNLIAIAKKFRITANDLMRINHLASNRIVAGKTLMVPIPSKNQKHYSESLTSRNSRRIANSARSAKGQRITYTVVRGDSFWALAQTHKVSTRQIAKWNNMAPGDPLKPGQKLVIWSQATNVAQDARRASITRKLSYKVRRGDSLARIASKFNIAIKDILRWNQISTRKYLQPGQALTLFVDVTGG